MHTNNRSDTRQTFFEVWRKLQGDEPMSALETIVAEVIRLHPEYHDLLTDAEKIRHKDWRPEGGETNPFLHMGMHIAIREQLSIDRPAGVKTAFAALLAQTGDAHEAEHRMLDCLAEALWRAQRENELPDEQAYLACLRGRSRR